MLRSWPAVLLLIAACDRVFDLHRPPGDPAVDGSLEAPVDAALVCQRPTGIAPTFTGIMGSYTDFSPSDDEALALVTQNVAVRYTESSGSMRLGDVVSPTGIAGMVGRVSLSPEGTTAYLYIPAAGLGAMVQVATRGATAAEWSVAAAPGLPDGYPGRPMRGDARIMVEAGGKVTEFAPAGGAWTTVGAYFPQDFGHPQGTTLHYANLSDDGLFLVYIARGTDSGIYVRERSTLDGSFSEGGARLRASQPDEYRSPTFVRGCTRLYVVAAISRSTGGYDPLAGLAVRLDLE